MKKEFLILILVIGFFAGCVGEAPKETAAPITSAPATQTPAPAIHETGYANPDALVDAAWVEAHLDDANVRIIATPAIKDSYDEGHIPGALYIDYRTDLVDLNAAVENQMASKEKVEELLRRLGIKNSDTLIVYDNTNNMIAARMFNVLKFHGHDEVRLLNGGKNAWTKADGELTTDVPEVTPSDYTAKDKGTAEYVNLEYVYRNLNNPDVQIVDVRPADQYSGGNVRPGIGRGGGHIPGAVNAPGGATWKDDKTFKSFEELRAFYKEAGVPMDKKVVVYCHNGMLASYSWFVLTQLVGHPNVAIYDGSSLEWTNHPDTPLVKGAEPGETPSDLKPL